MFTTKRLSLAFAMLLVAGCSGGGGTSNVPRATTPVQPGTPVTTQSKMVTVKIHIPAVPAQKTASRHRAYVSPYTNYALVSETDSGYTTELTQVGTDLSASSSACTFDSGTSGPRTCTVQINATGGQTDYFEFDTYSVSEASAIAAPDTALSTAVPTANRLGSARTSATISLDASNTVNAALGGVVVSYAVSPAVISGDGSQSISGQYSLTALDSSNDVIIAGSADPYTDGTNYPLTFTYGDSPMIVQTGNTPASAFLTLTPGGPDATTATPPTSTFSQSGDYLSASYYPYFGYTSVSSYYDTITFTATNSSIANPTQSALFAPIFLDGSSATGGATFTQNDTNPAGSSKEAASHRSRAVARGRALRRFESSGGAGNNYPIVSFTGSGQSVVITPSEYTGSSPGQTFTPTLASGCTVPTGSTTGPTVTVAPISGTPGAFTVTATSAAQTSADGGYTATDANGQPITACSISFADSNGNSALLEVTNTQSTSTIAIDPGTLVTSNSGSGEITLFDTSQSLAQITQFKGEANAPIGVEKDGLGNVYVAQNNQIFQYTPSSYASQNPDATAVTFETEGADTSGTQPFFTTLAYHETNSSTHTGTLIAGDGSNGRVYFFSTTAANTPIGGGTATSNYIQIPASGGNGASVDGVAFDAQGDVYAGTVLASSTYVIYEYAASTTASGSASVSSKPIRTITLGPGMQLYGIALDAVGNVFAADPNSGSIYEFQTYPTANNTGTPNVTITSACDGMNDVAVATASNGTDSVYGGCQNPNLSVYLATGITTSSASPTATVTGATGNFVAF
jgi:hypothetical protein